MSNRENLRQLRTAAGRVAVELLERRQLLSGGAGSADTTFNSGKLEALGDVTGSSGATYSFESIAGTAITLQNRIIVAGVGSDTGDEGPVALVEEYNPDGTLYTGFGDGGAAIVDGFDQEGTLTVGGVAVAPNGNILVATNWNFEEDDGDDTEEVYNNINTITPAGSDTGETFVLNNFSGDDIQINAMTVTPSGQAVVVGYGDDVTDDDGDEGPLQFAAEEIDADTLSGGNVLATPTEPADSELTSVAAGANGTVLVGGFIDSATTGSSSEYLGRFTSSGAVDTSFSFKPASSDPLAKATGVTAIATRPDGKIDVASDVYNEVANTYTQSVSQLTSAGSTDTSYNGTGYHSFSTSTFFTSIAVQSDDKIVLGGVTTTGSSTDYNLTRLTSAGALDSTFGTSSSGTTLLGTSSGTDVTQILLDGDGRIVLLTSTGPATGQLIRFLPGEYAFGGAPIGLSTTGPTTIQAENFDNGGEGVAYHDQDPENYGGQYRASGVDIYETGNGPVTSDTGPNTVVGFIVGGEYLKYTINIPTAEAYTFSALGGGIQAPASLSVLLDGISQSGSITIPQVGSTYTNFGAALSTFSAGTHVLELYFGATVNSVDELDSFTLTPVKPVSSGGSVSGTVSGGKAGETIYLDANSNGMLDTGELTTTTSSTGAYSFTNVPAGAYIVRQVLPTGYSQNSPADGYGIHITVTSGGSLTNQNFTDTPPVTGGSVSGTVTGGKAGETIYLDANSNGALDSGELTTTTSSTGAYSFSGVPAGAYVIRQVLPSGYAQTSPSNGYGIHITVAAGGSITGQNFTDTAPKTTGGSVSGTVTDGKAGETIYLDANSNGTLDSGELTTTTTSTGTYGFSDVPAGAYIIRQVLPGGYTQVTPSNGYGIHITVAAGESLTGQNFTDTAPKTTGGTISGTVTDGKAGETIYLDANSNGTLDNGELTTTTSSTGAYSFSSVPAGAYIIRQVLPGGYTQVTPTNGYGIHITVTTGGSLTGQNFSDKGSTPSGGTVGGTVTNGKVGETIYLDANNNSTLDTGELTTTTNSSDGYTFTSVPAGAYVIRQVLPGGYTQTSPSGGYGIHITVATGGSITGQNFTDTAPAAGGTGTVSGTVYGTTSGTDTIYLDANNNGKLDPGEMSTTSSAFGAYSFDFTGVKSGSYVIRQELSSGTEQTYPASNAGISVTVTAGADLTSPTFADRASGSTGGSIYGQITDPDSLFAYLDTPSGTLVEPGELNEFTGAYGFDSVPAGSYIIYQSVSLPYVQVTPANNAGIHVTVANNQVLFNENFVNEQGPDAPGTHYQAESASLGGGAFIASTSTGYTGSGYVDLSTPNSSITFDVTVPTVGDYTLYVRYAYDDATAGNLQFYVNGVGVAGAMVYGTGSNSNWEYNDISSLQLSAGSNSIELVSTASDGPLVDYISI